MEELTEEEIEKVLTDLEHAPKLSRKKEAIEEPNNENLYSDVKLTEIEKALKIEFPSTVLIAGATNTGKTMLMLNLIYANAKQFNRIYLLSPIADDPIYDFIPGKYRISNPSDADLQFILDEQKKNRHVKTCIICDDCIGKINFDKGQISKMITTTGRHFNLSFIVIMQYLNNIHPIIRDNAKVLFITKLKSHCVDSIYGMTSCFQSKNQCRMYLNNVCRDFRVCRFNLTGYNDEEVVVFTNKIPRNFRLNF
jgi:hypothetical protein